MSRLSSAKLEITEFIVLNRENAQKLRDLESNDISGLEGLMFSKFDDVLAWIACFTKAPLPDPMAGFLGLNAPVRNLEWIARIDRYFLQELDGSLLIRVNDQFRKMFS
jgi:hypothetical protein